MPATTKCGAAGLKRPAEKWVEVPVKIILSGAAVFFFMLLLHLMQLWYASNPWLAGASKSLPKTARQPDAPAVSAGGVETFWPHFPGSLGSAVHRMAINGVDTISEDWQTSAAGANVIAYYRDQMLARGWQDETEEHLKLQPNNRSDGLANSGLQNPEYVKKYGSLMDSSLIMYRAPWSLQVMAAPSEQGIRQTSVRIFAATTTSIEDFCLSIGEEAFKVDGLGRADGSIDTVQESGGQRCHTTIAMKNEEPVRLFNEKLKEYHDKDWRVMVFNPTQQRPSVYCAWFVKGRSYAAMSVKAMPQNHGSTVTLTEVTPAEQ